MTRINTIPVEDLLDEWLLAEYRELKRIPNKVRSGGYKSGWIPDDYRMGFGHERFFLDKLVYLKHRHDDILYELSHRFRKDYTIKVDISDLDESQCNDWTPAMRDHRINVGRLVERFNARTKPYHYNRQVVTEDMFRTLYSKYISINDSIGL